MSNEHEYTDDQKIMIWSTYVGQLARTKVLEAELRADILSTQWVKIKVGTNTKKLGHGYELKAYGKLNYSLAKNKKEKDNFNHILIALSKLPVFLADKIITWEPKFQAKVYESMTKEEQNIINEILTITSGSPKLELRIPTK